MVISMKNKEKSFEEAITGLEEKVKLLESGNISLDDSLKAFEEAISLARLCNEKLESAEAKVRMLVEGEDGSVTDLPFDKNEA